MIIGNMVTVPDDEDDDMVEVAEDDEADDLVTDEEVEA